MSASAIDDSLPDAHFIAKPFPLHRIVDTVSQVLAGDAGAATSRSPPACR